MANELKVNFYQLTPEADALPVLRRALAQDEPFNEWETLLKVPEGDGYLRYAILSQFPFSGQSEIYDIHTTRFERLPRQTRIRLLDDGLVHHFRERGCSVVRKKFCFDVLDKESSVPCRALGLSLDRGLTFYLDHTFKRDRLLYGYFVTVKIRRSFTDGLADPVLAPLSIGRHVYIRVSGGSERDGTLESVTEHDAIVKCNGNDEVARREDVIVPAYTDLVLSYLRSKGAAAKAYAEILEDEQIAALRRTKGGRKRSDAVKAQNDYVMTWLIRNSEYGRLRFAWPFSDKRISMVTTPYAVIPAEVS